MKEKIIELLRKHPNLQPTVIADQIGARADSVRKALTILRRQEKVTRRTNGDYILWEALVPAHQSSGVDDAGRL